LLIKNNQHLTAYLFFSVSVENHTDEMELFRDARNQNGRTF